LDQCLQKAGLCIEVLVDPTIEFIVHG